MYEAYGLPYIMDRVILLVQSPEQLCCPPFTLMRVCVNLHLRRDELTLRQFLPKQGEDFSLPAADLHLSHPEKPRGSGLGFAAKEPQGY